MRTSARETSTLTPCPLACGWSGHPFKMLQELDATFDAVALIGWHGPVGDGGNPLSHTMTGRYARAELDGAPMSELVLHAHLAATIGVPVVFVSGDAALCAQAETLLPG